MPISLCNTGSLFGTCEKSGIFLNQSFNIEDEFQLAFICRPYACGDEQQSCRYLPKLD